MTVKLISVREQLIDRRQELTDDAAPNPPRPKPSEKGYILIAVIFLLALLILAMSIALPNISKQIERDREIETMHRGKQYVRAIKLYHKKFGNYPPNVDALVNTNQIRFLRKKYIDPITGKNEWKPIHLGQNKLPTAFGFFGQADSQLDGRHGRCRLRRERAQFVQLRLLQFWLIQHGLIQFRLIQLSQRFKLPTGRTPHGSCPPDASSTAGASGNRIRQSNRSIRHFHRCLWRQHWRHWRH